MAAVRGGAQRVELCSSLGEGGITPSAGLIEMVRARTTIGLQVMIRPRGGDFCYTPDEFEIMQRDILAARKLGADGVVFGILHPNASVDIERTRRLVELSRPLNVTFHRAFDVSADLSSSLEEVAATGANRILTSGGERETDAGAPVIERLVKQAGGRIAIMACGGIRAHNAARILERTKVKEIHAALRSRIPSPMVRRQPVARQGTALDFEIERFEVIEQEVRDLCQAAMAVQAEARF